MKFNLQFLVIAFIGCIIFSSCSKKKAVHSNDHKHSHNHDHSSDKHDHPTHFDGLLGEWILIELDGRNVHHIGANISFIEGYATAYSGCNTMHKMAVTLSDKDQNIMIDQSKAQSTMIACNAKSIEQQYFNLLQKAYHFNQRDKVLIISSATGVEMLFTKSKK